MGQEFPLKLGQCGQDASQEVPMRTPKRLLKGGSKFCRLCITDCRISSNTVVWPEKPSIIERQKHHVRNSLKMLVSLKWVVFGKDGPYARA